MEQYIINLFQDMSLLTIILLSSGLLLCVAEVFVPKIGISGLLGITLLFSGFSSYYIDGFRVKYIIGLLGIVTVILSIFIMIELIMESKGLISNPNRYKLRTYNGNIANLQSLVGQKGKAITNIDLGGTIEIGGKLYYATSTSGIVKGSAVEVIGVKNNALVVR